jgi:hypothetical protein
VEQELDARNSLARRLSSESTSLLHKERINCMIFTSYSRIVASKELVTMSEVPITAFIKPSICSRSTATRWHVSAF